jgi:hypothetical protein
VPIDLRPVQPLLDRIVSSWRPREIWLFGSRARGTAAADSAIYLCEQAAEKLIRAVLTSEKVHAGVRHQLDEMVSLIPEENPIKPRLRELQQLSTYATSYRYTTPTGTNSCGSTCTRR